MLRFNLSFTLNSFPVVLYNCINGLVLRSGSIEYGFSGYAFLIRIYFIDLGRSCLSIALSLARSDQAERDNESCFFVRAASVHRFVRRYHVKNGFESTRRQGLQYPQISVYDPLLSTNSTLASLS